MRLQSRIGEAMTKNLGNLEKTIDLAKKTELFQEQTAFTAQMLRALEADKAKYLEKIQSENKIKDILQAEKLFLSAELIGSKKKQASIDTALRQWDEGLTAMSIVKNKNKYQGAYYTYGSAEKDAQDLPLDAFRKFIRSHLTRLDNSLASESSPSKATTLKQRQANLRTAESLYKEMQRQALQAIRNKKNERDQGR